MKPAGLQLEAPPRPFRTALLLLAILAPIQIGAVLYIDYRTSHLVSQDYVQVYKPVATAIVEGRGPVLPDSRLSTFYPVGFPLYVAGLMAATRPLGLPTDAVVMAAAIACNLAAVLGLFLLGYRLGGLGLAVAAGLTLGLYPPCLYMATKSMAAAPYLPIVVWGLYALDAGCLRDRLRWLAVAGAAFGCAAMFRPHILPILVLLLAYLLILGGGGLGRRVLRLVLILAPFALAISPWIIYIYAKTGTLVVLPGVLTHHALGAGEGGFAEGPTFFRGILDSPLQMAAELARRAALALYRTDSGKNQALALLLNAPFILLTLVGLATGLRSARLRWHVGLFLMPLLAAWTLSIFTIALARYTYEGLAVSALVPAVGLLAVYDAGARLRRRATALKPAPTPPPSRPRRPDEGA